MSYEYFYAGNNYSLDPKYGDNFTGYRMSAANLGMATDMRTANQLQEVSGKLSVGAKVMEISQVQSDTFESIPQQHLKEINRLSKLTGVDLTFHAPFVEASGYTKEGWDEAGRKQAEAQMLSAVVKGHELKPEGNINITFHSAVMLPMAQETMKEKGGEEIKSALIADPRTGQIQQIKKQEKFFPEAKIPEELKAEFAKKYHLTDTDIQNIETGKKFFPEWEIEKENKKMWDKMINNVNFYASRGQEAVGSALNLFPTEEGKMNEAVEMYSRDNRDEILKERVEEGQLSKDQSKIYQAAFRNLDHGKLFLRDSYNELREYYNRSYKDASPDDKKVLDGYKEKVEEAIKQGIPSDPKKLGEFAEIVEEGVKVLGQIKDPKIFVPLNDFLIDKSSETFSNVALQSYKKFGDKSPIISIENPPMGQALSRAEELKELIEVSRKKFAEKAQKEGMSKSDAESAAKKLIGATWDVGHINMLRKYGYDKVDLIKEAKTIAPFTKHVHLSDNFGFEHTELPMGMGNVPIKEIMEKLGEEGFEGKKIVEAGNWFQHFKTPPFTQSLEAFGSPLYAMKAPYWNQIASAYGNYFATPSAYLPEQHFSLYGGGFSALPQELGGQIPGRESRVSGTPMA